MAKSKKQDLPPLLLTAAGRNEDDQQANLNRVLPSPGYPTCVHVIVDSIDKRSSTTVFDFTPQVVNIRYHIDGVWHTMPQMDRETGDFMMATLKQLAGMNYRERRMRQEGGFQAMLMKKRFKCRVVSQGVKTGERIALYINIPEPPLDTLEDMGIKSSTKSLLMKALERDRGLILVSAMPGEGFSATWRATLSACDRLMRDFYVLEEISRVEPEVINVKSMTYDESKQEDPFTFIPNLLLQEPNVLAFNEPTSGSIIDQMVDLSARDFLIITRIHGKHCLDALLRLLVHEPRIKPLADELQCVLCMRVVRKLCPECRIPYNPHPQLLAQLGIPEGRIRHFYRAFEYEPGMLDEDENEIVPCQHCAGIGYRERTGIFEVLTVTDALRKALAENPRLDHLSVVARSQGHVSMRDMGVVAVAGGITSLEEVQRVLKK